MTPPTRPDRRRFLMLGAAAAKLGVEPRFQVISGFRSAYTNEMLRRTSTGGVARKSPHLQGRAIDVRLQGIDCAALRAWAG